MGLSRFDGGAREQRVLSEGVGREVGRWVAALNQGEKVGQYQGEVTLVPGGKHAGHADLPAGAGLGDGKAGIRALPFGDGARESRLDLVRLATWNDRKPAPEAGPRVLLGADLGSGATHHGAVSVAPVGRLG